MVEAILELKNIRQVFATGFWMRRNTVLADVNLQLAGKKVTGLVGANGVGKTTLIQIICGVRNPTAGQALYRGQPVGKAQVRKHLGFMPERPYFYDFLSAEKILAYLGKISGLNDQQITKRSAEVLDLVKMSGAAKRELRTYSKGMLQRVGIAQALLHDPDLLVFDEPMSGLDPPGRRDMREILLRLKDRGKTVLFSSHIIEDVEACCDEVIVLEKGGVATSGEISTFIEKQESRIELLISGLNQDTAGLLEKDADHFVEVPGGRYKAAVANQKSADRLLRKIVTTEGRVESMQTIRPQLSDLVFGKPKVKRGARRGDPA